MEPIEGRCHADAVARVAERRRPARGHARRLRREPLKSRCRETVDHAGRGDLSAGGRDAARLAQYESILAYFANL